jgi:hypothetical protein
MKLPTNKHSVKDATGHCDINPSSRCGLHHATCLRASRRDGRRCPSQPSTIHRFNPLAGAMLGSSTTVLSIAVCTSSAPGASMQHLPSPETAARNCPASDPAAETIGRWQLLSCLELQHHPAYIRPVSAMWAPSQPASLKRDIPRGSTPWPMAKRKRARNRSDAQTSSHPRIPARCS